MIVLHPSHLKLSTIRDSEPGSVVRFVSGGQIVKAIVIEADNGAHGILYIDPPNLRNVYAPVIDDEGLDLKCASLTYHSYSIEIDESTIQDAATVTGDSTGSLTILKTGPHILAKQFNSPGHAEAGFEKIPICVESWLPAGESVSGFVCPKWRLLGILDGASDVLFDTMG